MKKFYWIIVRSFIFLSLFTMIVNFFAYSEVSYLISSLFVLIINFNLIYLINLFLLKTKVYNKKHFEPVFFIILTLFMFWYILSSILFLFNDAYLSRTSLSYFISFLNPFWFSLSLLVFAILITALTRWLYRFPTKRNMPGRKLNYFLLCLFLISFFVSFAFFSQANESSPVSKTISGTISSVSTFLFHRERFMISSTESIPLLNISSPNSNIIFIVIDSVSSEHLPCYGYERNVTPNIDWFCKNSLVFENAYSSATHTELSQTSLFSSLSPLRYKIRDSFKENYPRRFIWDVLKKQGYQTAYFSSEDDGWMNMIEFYNKTNLDIYSHSFSDNKTEYGVGNFRKDYDETTTKSAIKWIGNSSRFFLALGFHATHYPYSYPSFGNRFFIPDTPSILSTYMTVNALESDRISDLNRYDNALRYADKQIGKIKEDLEKNNLINNTIIVITSDHGEALNYTDIPFRHGYGIYEEEIHVPLLIYIPHQKSQRIEDKVTLLDLVPTILNISGNNEFEGFQGKPFSKNRTLFFITQSYNFKIGMIKGNLKYIINMNDYSYEHYDIIKDPRENNNLVRDIPKTEISEEILKGFSELLAWHDCQIEYYEDKEYENGRILNCE